MTDRTKFEAMLEALINEDQETAKEIFHNLVVEKSREIYEELLESDFGGSIYEESEEEEEEECMTSEAFGEEEEEEEASDEEASDEEGEEEEASDEEGEEDFGDEEEIGDDDSDLEDRVDDLEDALESLKAEFEQLMADEEDEPEHADMFGDEEPEDEFGGEEPETGSDEFDTFMEYVNKVALPKHGDNGVNTKSVVDNMKNDMGGSNKNIAKGGNEEAPDGKQYKGPSNEYTKGQGQIEVTKRQVNQPGGKGADNFFGTKETSYESNKGAEGQTTDGKVPVQDKSILKHIK